ncbi:AAA family ATPase [Faecalicatena orotica]|uniref:AAA family ATPase n=1 Tax=Faecalicatena orotica TaxID=1544 RepID=UPI0032170E8C
MIQLDKIEVSNARRLGEKVQIEFGEGATILLAPNGTGKTTIFEAIELAITGEVQRLRGNKDAFVNAKSDNMNVELYFNNKEFIKATLHKNGVYNREGDINKILGISQDISIPYLFKMTHFFEQNTKNWFVSCDDTEAGKLLNSLPISSEIQNILSKKTSVLRSFTNIENNVKMEWEKYSNELKTFEELLNKKVELNATSPELKLEDVLKGIKSLALKYDVQIETYDNDLNKLSIKLSYVRNKIVEMREKCLADYNKLFSYEDRIKLYIKNKAMITEKNEKINIYKSEKKKKEQSLNGLVTEKNKLMEELDELSQSEFKVGQIISQFNELELKKKEIVVNKENIEKYRKEEKETEEFIENQNKKIEDYCHSQSVIQDFQDSLKRHNEKLINLEKKKEKLNDIEEKISTLLAEKTKLQGLKNLIDEENEKKVNVEEQVGEYKRCYVSQKQNVELLKKSETEIESALSVIRQNITEESRICPLCQAKYEPGVLLKKITKILTTLNPLFNDAIIEEKKAHDLVKKHEKSLAEIEKNIETLNTEYDKTNQLINQNNIIIDQIKRDLVLGEESFEYEKSNINLRIREQKKVILELKSEEEKLPKLDIEDYNNVMLLKQSKERRLAQLKSEINSLKLVIANNSSDIEALEKSIKDKDSDESVAEKNKYTTELINCKQKLLSNENKYGKTKDEFQRLTENIIYEEEALSTINATQANLLMEWKEFNLGKNPDEQKVKNECVRLEGVILQIKKDLQAFYDLQNRLSAWRIFLEDEEISKKIASMAGTKSAEKYHNELKNKVIDKAKKLEDITMKKEAVNAFLNEILKESDEVQLQLGLINDSWKRILKRIVINPLITTAPLLKNETHRNKQMASTIATIRDKGIDITDIASEGQIADIQLSFILALANEYSWTPWKALLLDDPVQHHDLVHASSVFDVLRDYIADLGYQIMLSTHDKLQADFFVRKLKNDGISSRIYQLVPRKEGVTVEQTG